MLKYKPLLFLIAPSYWSVYLVRAFVPVFVLLALLVHQLLFPAFIDSNLTVFGYTLCAVVLFFETVFLFFYKDNQNRDFCLFLFFLSALFLVLLTVLLEDLNFLFIIFFLVFIQVFPLFLLGKAFLAFIFLIYLSILFPIAFIWTGVGMYEERLSLAVFTNFTLFLIFIFSFLFYFLLNLSSKVSTSSVLATENFRSEPDLALSLNLSKKLRLILSALIKNFSAEKNEKKIQLSVFQQELAELKNLKQFMLDFIEFSELNKNLFSFELVDAKKLLIDSLNDLNEHKRRPENLAFNIEAPDSFKIKADLKYLKKCFQNILINSFEALQNEKNPEIKIYCLRQKNHLSIQFLDNGHGIEEEDLNSLFDPLVSKRFGLRGLGLSYAKKIVQAHEGEIKIERIKDWTKVLIRLPLIESYYNKFDFLKMLKAKKAA